jgi:hypothetical protein
MRPSHGRPRGHRSIVCPSVRKRPHDNPECKNTEQDEGVNRK